MKKASPRLLPDVTYGDALDRVDDMKKLYATEELRVEGNFIAILLPSSLSLIAIQSGPSPGAQFRDAILVFFAVYLGCILHDLVQVSLWNSRVTRIQSWMYRNLSGGCVNEGTIIGNRTLREDYEYLERHVAKRKYIAPLAKIAAAVFAGCLAWSSS